MTTATVNDVIKPSAPTFDQMTITQDDTGSHIRLNYKTNATGVVTVRFTWTVTDKDKNVKNYFWDETNAANISGGLTVLDRKTVPNFPVGTWSNFTFFNITSTNYSDPMSKPQGPWEVI